MSRWGKTHRLRAVFLGDLQTLPVSIQILAIADHPFAKQVKVAWVGNLTNETDICELYAGCEKLKERCDPAQLVLTLYLQVTA